MKTIDMRMLIKYDEEKEQILDYDFMNEYTLAEVAVIVATFKKCLNDWGYDVIRKEE